MALRALIWCCLLYLASATLFALLVSVIVHAHSGVCCLVGFCVLSCSSLALLAVIGLRGLACSYLALFALFGFCGCVCSSLAFFALLGIIVLYDLIWRLFCSGFLILHIYV